MVDPFINPYALQIAEKLKEEYKIDSKDTDKLNKLKVEIDELRELSAEFTNQKLDEINNKIAALKEERKELNSMPKDNNKQFKEVIARCTRIYKDALQLFLETREIRKGLREQRQKDSA